MNYKHKLKTNTLKTFMYNLHNLMNAYIRLDTCARNVWIVISIFTYDFSLLGLVASQAEHISFEVLDWLVCGWPWLLRLTELDY